jgi:hypothetical protein
MAQAAPSKSQILRDAGYVYNFDRMVYFNRAKKKVFSVQFVEDHNETDLQKYISEETNGADWRFYFNSRPPGGVKRELENVLA